MNIGMLWFDNDPNSDLPTKVTRAASYYTEKYGKHPNLCFVHPSGAAISEDLDPENQSFKSGDIEVRLTKSVLPNHFWIGVHNLNGN